MTRLEFVIVAAMIAFVVWAVISVLPGVAGWH